MEIIISNKQIKQLAEINKAKEIESFSYSGSYKFKFISLNQNDLVKCILYVDHENNYILEQRR